MSHRPQLVWLQCYVQFCFILRNSWNVRTHDTSQIYTQNGNWNLTGEDEIATSK